MHLEKAVGQQTVPQREMLRSGIVLLAAEVLRSRAIVAQLRRGRVTVVRRLLPQLPAEEPLPFAVDFLAGFSGRVQLYLTLTRASWLNQIELRLGLLQ